jgi:hypothetical protein
MLISKWVDKIAKEGSEKYPEINAKYIYTIACLEGRLHQFLAEAEIMAPDFARHIKKNFALEVSNDS